MSYICQEIGSERWMKQQREKLSSTLAKLAETLCKRLKQSEESLYPDKGNSLARTVICPPQPSMARCWKIPPSISVLSDKNTAKMSSQKVKPDSEELEGDSSRVFSPLFRLSSSSRASRVFFCCGHADKSYGCGYAGKYDLQAGLVKSRSVETWSRKGGVQLKTTIMEMKIKSTVMEKEVKNARKEVRKAEEEVRKAEIELQEAKKNQNETVEKLRKAAEKQMKAVEELRKAKEELQKTKENQWKVVDKLMAEERYAKAAEELRKAEKELEKAEEKQRKAEEEIKMAEGIHGKVVEELRKGEKIVLQKKIHMLTTERKSTKATQKKLTGTDAEKEAHQFPKDTEMQAYILSENEEHREAVELGDSEMTLELKAPEKISPMNDPKAEIIIEHNLSCEELVQAFNCLLLLVDDRQSSSVQDLIVMVQCHGPDVCCGQDWRVETNTEHLVTSHTCQDVSSPLSTEEMEEICSEIPAPQPSNNASDFLGNVLDTGCLAF